MKTYSVKAGEIERAWHVIDADGQPLGRLATQVATLLKGKHKPTYAPHLDTGDFVIVVNAAKVVVSGNKAQQKVYYRHTQYPGGLRVTPYAKLLATRPERVIEKAVKGMLPHNRLGAAMLKKLKVYAGPTHRHEAQVNAGRAKAARAAAEARAVVAAPLPPLANEALSERPAEPAPSEALPAAAAEAPAAVEAPAEAEETPEAPRATPATETTEE